MVLSVSHPPTSDAKGTLLNLASGYTITLVSGAVHTVPRGSVCMKGINEERLQLWRRHSIRLHRIVTSDGKTKELGMATCRKIFIW